MKRVTMELGGHAPAIVFADADIDARPRCSSADKFRNAGQVCVAPTRFLVQEPAYDEFVGKFVEPRRPSRSATGSKTAPAWVRSPTRAASTRWKRFVGDAVAKGAKVADRRPAHRQQGLLLRADRADQRAA